MKKRFIILIVLFIISKLYSNTLDLNLNKDEVFYDKNEVIKVMQKYHKKYGKGEDIDYEGFYHTVKYWSKFYDINFIYALSFYAIESGYTLECVSSYSAVGVGQLTSIALTEYNNWYKDDISFKTLNEQEHYDINVKVSLGYLRLCWDKYTVIENGTDLLKSYNIGVGNLRKIKNGTYLNDDFWVQSANKYERKFTEVYNDFAKCRR